MIGADGRNCRVAKAVQRREYNDKPRLQYSYYTYFSGLPDRRRSRSTSGPTAGWAAAPTNDGLTMVVVGWPYAEADGLQGRRRGQLPQDPRAGAGRSPSGSRGATREAPFLGGAVPDFFRKPYGPGWALVGDAGYNKDPITAQGITDAFLDAELCADRHSTLASPARTRSTTRWPPTNGPRRRQAHADLRVHHPAGHAGAAAAGDAAAARRRARQPGRRWTVSSASSPGAISAADFFSEENVGRIFAAVPAGVPAG